MFTYPSTGAPYAPDHRSHILLYAALHVGWGVAYTGTGHYFQSLSKLLSPVALIDQRHMYGPRHTYVHQMCTAPAAPPLCVRVTQKSLAHIGDQKICALRARLSALTRNEGSTKWKGA